jgi:uncharacterized membrane protein
MPGNEIGPSFTERLTRTFITGVFGLLPLALTLAVLAWVVVFLYDLVGLWLAPPARAEEFCDLSV